MVRTCRFCFSLFLVILCLLAPMLASGEETELPVDMPSLLDDLFSHPYIACDTIPEGESLEYGFPISYSGSLIAEFEGNYYQTNSLDTVEITLLNGDETMKDAVVLESPIPNNPAMNFITIRPEMIRKPGDTDYRIRITGKAMEDPTKVLVYEKVCTLHAIAYEGPVLSFPSDPVELSLPRRYISEQELIGQTAVIAPYASGISVSQIAFTMDRDGKSERLYSYQFTDLAEGDYSGVLTYWVGTLQYQVNANIHITALQIFGSATLCAGQKTPYFVYDYSKPDETRYSRATREDGWVFRVEEGPAVMQEYQVLAVNENAKAGETILLTAESPDGGMKLSKTIRVTEGGLSSFSFHTETLNEFELPVPDGFYVSRSENLLSASSEYDSDYSFSVVYRISIPGKDYYSSGKFDRDAILDTLEQEADNLSERNGMTSTLVELNDLPALLSVDQGGLFERRLQNGGVEEDQPTYNYANLKGEYPSYGAHLYYVTPDYRLSAEIELKVNSDTGTLPPPVSLEEYYDLFRKININGEAISLKEGDPVPEFRPETDVTELLAGESLPLILSEETMRISKERGGIVWSVESYGKEDKHASVSNNILKVAKGLNYGRKVNVRASYRGALNRSNFTIYIYPIQKKIAINSFGERAQNYLYLDANEPMELHVYAVPSGAKYGKITWSAKGNDLIELTEGENNGTAFVKALKLGKTTVTAKDEDSGKTAEYKLEIVQESVKAVRITGMKGSPKPGKTVTLTTEFTPEKPVKKDLRWEGKTEDGEYVFVNKGKLKIDKSAKPGDKITVTCTSSFNSEPVSDTYTVIVE